MNLHKQQGDFLLESLIGMVLMAIIGMGVVSVTGKVSVGQRDMNVQTIVINQMRSALIENGSGNVDICAVPPSIALPGGEAVVVEMQGCAAGINETTTVTISDADPNGVGISQAVVIPKPIVISASSTAFDGDIVVGGTWQ